MLIKSHKMSEVSGALANMSGVVSIQEIIDTILQITNLKTKTESAFQTDCVYSENEDTVYLKDLYVDMSYQRTVQLTSILNKLKKVKGFQKRVGGAIDVSVRPDGRSFVWDGLRRSIMAGLCGMDRIRQSKYDHPLDRLPKECQMEEALDFKIRNAGGEKMKPEEIFKARTVYRDPEALELLDVIINCGLDVVRLNPDGKVLGGFNELERNFTLSKNPLTEEYLVRSSKIIQHVYKKESNVSVYLLCGLAWLLMVNDNVDVGYSDDEIVMAFEDFTKTNPRQKALINARLSGKQRESVAYLIAKNVLGDTNGLIKTIGLDADDINLVEELY